MKMPGPIKSILKMVMSPEKYAQITQKIQQALTPKLNCYTSCMVALRDQHGFEIGGPSPIFSSNGLLPLYRVVGSLDNCNFSDQTTWEGALSEGRSFKYDEKKRAGYQYIRDAVDLHGIESDSFDFILSSHNLEHIANPIKALKEWLRVLKVNGLLVLILPHKDATFDHLRPVTAISHLIEDYEKGTTEDDLTHLDEVLRLHDLTRDDGIDDTAEFQRRSERNFENRCLHQHVFDSKSVISLIDYLGLEICSAEAVLPLHIICVARKLSSGILPDNENYLSGKNGYLIKSPFGSDRV